MPETLTSQDVARLLGVGVSSVNRWADSGLLSHTRTPGGHRRFRRLDVDVFSDKGSDRSPPKVGRPETAGSEWIDLLTSDAGVHAVQGRLLTERDRLGGWPAVATVLGAEIARVGALWAEGRLTVLQEHIVSERLSRALARCGEGLSLAADAPRALLATAEDEDHTLGLSLTELCLRDLGWSVVWSGRRTPTEDLRKAVLDGGFRALALSASEYSSKPGPLRAMVDQLVMDCAAMNVLLVLGGEGAWPDPEAFGALSGGIRRVHGFGDLGAALSR